MSLQIFSAATGNTPLRHYENPPGPTPTGDYQPSLRSPWLAATVKAYLNEKIYEKGLKVTNAEVNALNLERSKVCPQWNYTIRPLGVSS